MLGLIEVIFGIYLLGLGGIKYNCYFRDKFNCYNYSNIYIYTYTQYKHIYIYTCNNR